jgi:hypothetical protein
MIIRHINTALFIVLLLASISNAGQVKLREEPLKPYNEKLSLNLMMSGDEIGSGYYSTNEEGILDGPIRIESNRSGYDKQVDANYSFVTAVSGNVKNGKKDGTWKYKYIYDDGIDLYESHQIEIFYQNDKCIRSNFEGVFGYIMPKTKHEFKSQKYCTPESIRNKAWDLWRTDFEKTKSSK